MKTSLPYQRERLETATSSRFRLEAAHSSLCTLHCRSNRAHRANPNGLQTNYV